MRFAAQFRCFCELQQIRKVRDKILCFYNLNLAKAKICLTQRLNFSETKLFHALKLCKVEI